MAEIFDASGVAAGQSDGLINLANIFTGAFDPFVKGVEKFVAAVEKFTNAVAGVGGKASGEQFKLGPAPADEMRKNDLLDEAFGFAPPKAPAKPEAEKAKQLPVARRIPVANPLAPGPGGLNPLGGAAGNAAKIAPQIAGPLGGIGGAGEAAGALTKIAPAATGASAALGPLAAAVAAVTVAVTAAVGAVLGMVAAAHHFVEFVNPALVQNFDAAMRDLNAVVGTLLVPVMTEATRVVRELAANLYPIVLDLLPSFQSVVRSFTDVFVELIPIGASVLQQFAAFAAVVAEFTRAVADFVLPMIRAFAAIMAGSTAHIKAVLSNLLGLFGGDFRKGVRSMGEALGLLAIAMVALVEKFLGFTDALNGMVADLKNGPRKQDATGLAVAQNARYQDVAGLGREVAQRAFVSSGRGEGAAKKDEQKELRDKAVRIIDGIQDGSLIEKIGEAVARGIIKGTLNAANPVNALNQLGEDGQIRKGIDVVEDLLLGGLLGVIL